MYTVYIIYVYIYTCVRSYINNILYINTSYCLLYIYVLLLLNRLWGPEPGTGAAASATGSAAGHWGVPDEYRLGGP